MTVSPPNHPARRLLVIDDDDDLRGALVEGLTLLGYDCVGVADGEAGLRELRRCPPALVLLDLRMPVMDGWQLRIEQRRDPVLRDIPVIAISASREPAAAAVDADAFVAKPFDLAALAAEVERVIAERAARRPSDRMSPLRTLTTGLVHEINNPLTYVMLHLDRLIRRVPGHERVGEDERAALIRGALDGVERIRAVTRAIGTFAELDDRQATLVDVRVALDAALRIADSAIGQRARLVREGGAPIYVHAPQGLLALAFLDVLTDVARGLGDGSAARDVVRIVVGGDGARNAVVEVADSRPTPDLPRPLAIARDVVRSLGGALETRVATDGAALCRVVVPGVAEPGARP